MSIEPETRRLAIIAAGVSFGLLLLRLSVAHGTGFGDAEALYASYALHPQPSYIEHPGLIGSIARLLGRGDVPSAELSHVATALAATLLPWVGFVAARLSGASSKGAFVTLLALALTPELSIGLFGLTPDLPLAFAWIFALGLTGFALRSEPTSFRTLLALLGAGACAGIACISKASGVLLVATILGALLTKPALFRTLGPWSLLVVVGLVALPVVRWEVSHGYPMLRHRLVTTQVHAGLSLRNLGVLIGGQLAYVTPPFLLAAGFLLVDLHKRRKQSPVFRLFWLATLVPGVCLVLLCLWSKVAEPHWVAPAYLPLALYVSQSDCIGRRLFVGCAGTGIAIALLAWTWVKTPLPMYLFSASYQPLYDVSNDLYVWGPGKPLLRDALSEAMIETRRLPVVVGPHYVVCAQAQAAIGNSAPVGCNTPRRDDFDSWYPRSRWVNAPIILYVHDSRFPVDPERELPNRIVRGQRKVDILRGGMVVRTIWVTVLEKTNDVGFRMPVPRPASQRPR